MIFLFLTWPPLPNSKVLFSIWKAQTKPILLGTPTMRWCLPPWTPVPIIVCFTYLVPLVLQNNNNNNDNSKTFLFVCVYVILPLSACKLPEGLFIFVLPSPSLSHQTYCSARLQNISFFSEMIIERQCQREQRAKSQDLNVTPNSVTYYFFNHFLIEV